GLLAASRSTNPDAVNAVVTGTQAVTMQGQLNFSRDVEREADRIGFQVMTAAGFAPGGMAAMFEKMDASMRLNDFGGFPYLRTHPLTVERIGEARARAGIGTTAPRVSVLEHTAAQARARVLMDPRVDALRRWQGRDAEHEGSAAEQLLNASESAQASSLLRDWARADAAFARALAITRGSPNSSARAERAVVLMQAQSLLDRGAPAKAAEAMKAYAGDASRPVLLLTAQVALAETPAVTPESAALKARAGELQTWVALHPADSLAWSALGQTWARLGVPLRSLRAEAESRYALGDLLGAVDRLRAGQRVARGGGAVDFIDASVIDSRLRDIEAQRKQIEADQRASR
ncbi:MAG: M48 family metalloprotease, partial [Caldimonas sp.]